jgi:hypothetical protein
MRNPVASIDAAPVENGGGSIVFGTGEERIVATFPYGSQDALAGLKPRQVVTVLCLGAGMTLGTPSLSSCELVRVEPPE